VDCAAYECPRLVLGLQPVYCSRRSSAGLHGRTPFRRGSVVDCTPQTVHGPPNSCQDLRPIADFAPLHTRSSISSISSQTIDCNLNIAGPAFQPSLACIFDRCPWMGYNASLAFVNECSMQSTTGEGNKH